MGSYNDWSNLMQSRPLPFYLNSETPEVVSGDVLPYQTQAESDPYTQAAEAGKTLMQNVVDEISGVSEQKRRLSAALAKMQAIKESGTITQGDALDFNPAAPLKTY